MSGQRDENIKFSVIMANHNRDKYIDAAIKSVLTQTYRNFELIIVDDYSTDHSRDVIDRHIGHQKITHAVYLSEMVSTAAAKDHGISLATGDVCCIVDSDDILNINALSVLSRYWSGNINNYSLAYSRQLKIDDDGDALYVPRWITNIPQGKTNLEVDKIHHLASFPTKKYIEIGGMNRNLWRTDDKDLYYRLEEVGDIMFINHVLYKHRIHPGGVSADVLETLREHHNVKKDAYFRRKFYGIKMVPYRTLFMSFLMLKISEIKYCISKGDSMGSVKHILDFITNYRESKQIGGYEVDQRYYD